MKELISGLIKGLDFSVAFIIGVMGALHLVKSILTVKPEELETMKTNWQRIKEANRKACSLIDNFIETNYYSRLFTTMLCISFILLSVVLGSIESNLLLLKGNQNILQILTPPILRVAASLPLIYFVLPRRINKRRIID